MNEHRSPALAKAIRRHENAITRRYIAGVQDTKAGQPSRSDVRFLSEAFERPIWEAVLATLDAYLAHPGQHFPPEIALPIAETLRELLVSGLPPTWAVLRHQGGPDSPRMMASKQAAVDFLAALDDPELGPALRAFREKSTLAKAFGVSEADISRWLSEAEQPRRWGDGSAIPFQHVALFRVLASPASVAGVAATYGGKTANTIRAWRRDPRLAADPEALDRPDELSLSDRVRLIWSGYANGAAAYRALSYQKRRRGKAAVEQGG